MQAEHTRILTARSLRSHLLTLVLLTGIQLHSIGQPYWALGLASLGNNSIADVQIDADGAVYVTGEYGGTAEFGGQILINSGVVDLFVARLDANGNVVWLKRGGGNGIDRGLKIALGGTRLALVGEFLGAATFQGTTMVSSGGTSDMFLAMLDKADGELQWLRQGGGAVGTDRPSGVSIAVDGSVCVTGEFRGTSTWGAISHTSVTDPLTGLPSTDVFIARYSATGNELWVRTGAAKFADRGVEIVHDGVGNIYVTGQFSDTITFDQTHTNVLLNASFLVCYNDAGNELWFRRFGGAGFNHVRDMLPLSNGGLCLLGDLQGSMIYFGNTQLTVQGGDPYAYYLLTVSPDGELLGQRTVGSSSPLSVNGLALNGSELAVIGQFNCQFTDLSDFYSATGLFMAVGPQDLFITRHSINGLAFQEAQQFGGRSNKSAGAVAYLGSDLVFCGSFERNLIFPSIPGFQADIQSGFGLIGNQATSYCSDPNYGSYAALLSQALQDGFLARGYVADREPYDWWNRPGAGCERDQKDICIRSGAGTECPDTLTECGVVALNVLKRFSHIPGLGTNYLGPPLVYSWSNGSVATGINVSATGMYSVTVSSENGCYQWTDSVYVVILPIPPSALVSDDVVVNTGTASPLPIQMCDPETHWLWSTNIPAVTQSYWQTPFDGQAMGDSVLVDTTGNYSFVLINEQGCQRLITVQVIDDPSPELPDLDVELPILFPDDIDLNDSLLFCPGGSVAYEFTPRWFVDGLPANGLPPGLAMTWGLTRPPITVGDGGPAGSDLPVTGPGWYTVDLWVLVTNEPCGEDSILFNSMDSIYVDLLPSQEVSVSMSGPTTLCDGDSAVLSASCVGCQTLTWSPVSVTLIGQDSILVSSAGTYGVSASVTDTSGCVFTAQASITIAVPGGFTLSLDPDDGILCPGGSAEMSTAVVGSGHIWYGPEGPITGEGASLSTTVPGEYYLFMIVGGCEVTSNNVELFSYGTPYLDLFPASALCQPGDELLVQVYTVPGAIIVWSAPLSGSALQQTVDAAGVYSCSVSACGITTELEVEVVSAPITATVSTPGPFVLCEGESASLSGLAIGSLQYWAPNVSSGPQLEVSNSGEYAFIVENVEGCRDTAAFVEVEVVAFSEPLVVPTDTVCSGSAITLAAQGSGSISWFSDAALLDSMGSGTPFTFTPTSTSIIYAVQQELGCIGDTVAVDINVLQRPDAISIDGPDQVCVGDNILIEVIAPDSITLLWTTPAGPLEGSQINIVSAAPSDQGVYACTPIWSDCTGATEQLVVMVNTPVTIEFDDPIEICEGAAIQLSVPSDIDQVIWSTGSNAMSITVTGSAMITVNAIDLNGCATTASTEVIVVPCELIIPNVFTPNGDNANDSWLPGGGFTSADAHIYDRWGDLVFEGDMVQRAWSGKHYSSSAPCSEGVYYYVIAFKRFDGQSFDQAGYIQLIR